MVCRWLGRVGIVRECSDFGEKAVHNPFDCGFHRASCKLGIASGGLELTVAEKFADHRKALAQGESPKGVAVS